MVAPLFEKAPPPTTVTAAKLGAAIAANAATVAILVPTRTINLFIIYFTSFQHPTYCDVYIHA